MSIEVVEGPEGLYVIIGDPTYGYEVRPVGQPIGRYQRKYVARGEIRNGVVEAVREEF